LTLFAPAEGEPPAILVVYDAAAKRRQPEPYALETDIFAL
jgi:hypothetical protein